MSDMTVDQAKQTKWYKRSKEESELIYQARKAELDAKDAERKAKAADQPSWGEIFGKGGAAEPKAPHTPSAPKPRRVPAAHFEGVALSSGGVRRKGQTHPLPATARVESAGEVRRRVSATRAVMTGGVGAFLFKKKVDDRELYLTIEGEGWGFVVDVSPKKGKQAREFATKVNAAR